MKVELPVVLTPTRVELADRCERRHQLSDVLERGKEKNIAAAFGNVIHAGVGALQKAIEYDQQIGDIPLDRAWKAASADFASQELAGRDDRYTLDKAVVMLAAYRDQFQRVGPFTAMPIEWKVLTIEDRIRLNIGEYILSFQIDRAFANKEQNRIAVVDLKTVSRPDARWKAQWYLNLQMKLYKAGFVEVFDIDEIDFAIEGLDKNVKPKLHYVPLPDWSPAMLAEAIEEFKYRASRDRAVIEASLLPNGDVDVSKLEELILTKSSFNYHDCDSYGSTCVFKPLCLAEPDERQGMLRAEYKEIEADY